MRPAQLPERSRITLRQSTLDKAALLCFTALVLLGFLDTSGDYPLLWGQPYRTLVPGLRAYTASLSTLLLAILAAIGVFNWLRGHTRFHAGSGVRLFLTLLTLSTLWGTAVGLFGGLEPRYVIGDAQNLVVYLCLPALGRVASGKRAPGLLALIWLGLTILTAKLLLSVATNLALHIPIAGRYLFKMSSYYLAMLFLSLSLATHCTSRSRRRMYLGQTLLAAIGVFAAQMRGFTLGAAAGLLLLAILAWQHRRLQRPTVIIVAVICLGAAASLAIQSDPSRILSSLFGAWGSQDLAPGVQYRSMQLDFLMSVFRSNWLLGAGLGWYDPNSGFYPVWSARPYIVELEYPNLLAKLGIIGFASFAGAFGFLLLALIRAARKAPTMEQRGLAAGWAAGLTALLVASATNPLISSMYFHLYVVVMLLTLPAIRSQSQTLSAPAGLASTT